MKTYLYLHSIMDELIVWLLRDPHMRLYDGYRFYDKPGSGYYKMLLENQTFVENEIRKNGYKLRIKFNTEWDRDAQGYNKIKVAQFCSDIHSVDGFVNLNIGCAVKYSDKLRYVKRCDACWKYVNDDWICSIDIINPGQFARILDVKDNIVYLIYNRTDIADIRELSNPNLIIQMKNDDGFVFLT